MTDHPRTPSRLPLAWPLLVLLATTSAGQLLAVVGGLLAAIVLHRVWDWAGLASPDPVLLFKVHGAVMVPVFLAVPVSVLVLRRRLVLRARVGSPDDPSTAPAPHDR